MRSAATSNRSIQISRSPIGPLVCVQWLVNFPVAQVRSVSGTLTTTSTLPHPSGWQPMTFHAPSLQQGGALGQVFSPIQMTFPIPCGIFAPLPDDG